MIDHIPPHFIFSTAVYRALELELPVVALESAVITHGLPHPQNLQLARELEEEVRKNGATPATIAFLHGEVHVGLTDEELDILADPTTFARKISRRDFGIALARKEKGGTTVAGTLIAAHKAGINVFATGGIGGIHRDAPQDVSADLPELGRTPLIVVCAGAKSILDLPATLEYLETAGVPVVGFQTSEFPAFYSRESGLPVNVEVTNAAEVAQIARAHWEMGMQSAVLVVAPPPQEAAVPREQMEIVIQRAIEEARQQNIHGAAVTPFLLSKVSQLSEGKSMQANLALLRNNAHIAAQIAGELYRMGLRAA